jgi:hypothetical protein
MKAEVPASGGPRPAISAANAGMAGVQAEVVGGNVMQSKDAKTSFDANAACVLIADGVRCVHNTRKVELHQAGANLKVIVSLGNVVWAGGDALVRSEDGGVNWADVKKPSAESIRQIRLMPDGVYVGGASGPMWKTTDNGATWQQATTQVPEMK